MLSRFALHSIQLLSVHASLLTAPDGTTKNAPTWPAAWYTGEAPAGTHDIVMLSDITVPYSPSTCDPSTYSTSIKGKVLLDTDGYGGESPLYITCFNSKAGKPAPIVQTLQKFKDSGAVAVISLNWWLPHQYYVSDIDRAFAVNPGPARAIGMPWYVGQNSWRDATATNFGLRYGWREMFGGAYADVMSCTARLAARLFLTLGK
jgi:hypothetical protein